MGKIQYGITKYDHQFFMLASEDASQGLITGLGNHAFSDPLPELSLRGPKLLATPADDPGRLLFLLLFNLLIETHNFAVLS